jgi:hypothetical protein
MFELFDRDGDGILSFHELALGLSPLVKGPLDALLQSTPHTPHTPHTRRTHRTNRADQGSGSGWLIVVWLRWCVVFYRLYGQRRATTEAAAAEPTEPPDALEEMGSDVDSESDEEKRRRHWSRKRSENGGGSGSGGGRRGVSAGTSASSLSVSSNSVSSPQRSSYERRREERERLEEGADLVLARHECADLVATLRVRPPPSLSLPPPKSHSS